MPVIILQPTDFEVNGDNVSISPEVMKNNEFSSILLLTDNGNETSKNTMAILGRFALKLQALNRDSIFYAADVSSFPLAENSTLAPPVLLKVWAGGMIDDESLSTGKVIREKDFLQILLHLSQHHYVLDGGLSLIRSKDDGFQYGRLAGVKMPNVTQDLQIDVMGNDRSILAINQNGHVDGDGTIIHHQESFMQRISHDRCLQRKFVICMVLGLILLSYLRSK